MFQIYNNKKDMYDIIIENATKEWYMSMQKTLTKETWEVPQYSKSQIDKAGKIIIASDIDLDERRSALEILNNWRSSHAYPLHVITSKLRRDNPKAIVVQRLKRLDSITGKLERFPEMSLYRMQDLGGCRVISSTIDEVYQAVNNYKESRIRHILKKEYDYIQNPKPSGYRSYHMVYQYHSEENDIYNKNMLIEIQFRTELEHIWATAVEVMGVYTKSQLKASKGDEDVLRFFTLASSLFALAEKTPECPNTSDDYDTLLEELTDIDRRLNIVSKLSALATAIRHSYTSNKVKGKGYYLLRLNFKERMVKVSGFQTTQIELATDIYNKIEESNNPDIDTVLVSATSFDMLKAAYPNYFADITKFVDIMREMI